MTTAEKIKEGCGLKVNTSNNHTICGEKKIKHAKNYRIGNTILCIRCQARLSQYKSDLQQELEFLKNILFHSLSDVTKMKIKKRINLIEKELKEIK